MFTVNRSKHNPLISPDKNHPWEAAATFNGSPAVKGKKTYLVYRAMSEPERLKEPHISNSVIARGISSDAIHFTDRKVLVSPSEEFDKFGCEDPRVTKLGGTYYIFYTGLGGYPFSADNIRVCVALSKDLNTVEEKHLVTPFNAKAMALFPEKIGGKMAALLTVNSDSPPSEICYAEFEKPEDMWSENYWKKWKALDESGRFDAHKLHMRRLPSDHLELGAAPVKTKKGWLLIYAHIQRYGQSDQVFGVEAVLLDLKNPRKIIGRTKGPFMVADEYYENAGQVPHLIFPSGASIKKSKSGDTLEIYYGAADTHCAKCSISLDNLLKTITDKEIPLVKRFPGNPIITSRPKLDWEMKGTFNSGAIELGGKTHILYRAVSDKDVSVIGYAASVDGLSIDERPNKPIYVPRADFEKNGTDDHGFGCEDPRITKIGSNVYMTYTAYDSRTPRVAISSISAKDFLKKNWKAWSKPIAITPEGVANKDSAIIPGNIGGKKENTFILFHRVQENICASPLPSLDFKGQVNQCIEIIGPRRGMWDGSKVGIAAPPIKTAKGWLLLYHGVSWSMTYRVGAILLDLKNPTLLLARTAVPLFEPEEEYERKGMVRNVVFPCGLVAKKNIAYMYYGGADSVVGVATFSIKEILKRLSVHG